MGTSSARKPPSGRHWRAAKAAAGRYLAAGAEPVRAEEVLERYMAALTAGEEGQPGPFRLARQVAQELGAFWEEQSGKSAAGGQSSLAVLARAQTLADAWVPEDGSLESAACRTALVATLCAHLPSPTPAATAVVRDFLAQVVAVRLYLDLGETLEALAGDCARLEEGWQGLRRAAAAALAVPEPPPPGAWRKLAGWLWLTRVLEGLRSR